MARRNYPNNQRKHSTLETVADDLPKGYLKAGLDLYNGASSAGKAAIVVAAGVAALFAINKLTSK